MALTRVRVNVEGELITLTYNEATGRYERKVAFVPPGSSIDTAPLIADGCTIIPHGSSVHQPGGYYNIEVETTNETGQVSTLDGTQYKALRQVVRETAAPTMELISPPPGWLTISNPTFVVQAQDEEGGSGIDPSSAKATIDGAGVPCTVTESGGIYTITFTGQALSEVPHTVTAAISDQDGNQSTVSAAYTVDTVPPALSITAPDLHRVVDWESVEVAGHTGDNTSGIASITVDGEMIEPNGSGHFSRIVPLEVGENNIPVIVTDKAGNSTTETIWMLRMITDRTQEDVDKLTVLHSRPASTWTTEEKEWFLHGLCKGAYNADDMNRVGKAVEYIAQVLEDAGYVPNVSPKTDWAESDIPTVSQTGAYLSNVAEIKSMVPVAAPEVPPDMERFEFGEANDIERILVIIDRVFPLLERSYVFSGEAFCGEF